MENPTAPHQYVEYDNLSRVTRRAIFGSVPSGIATLLADRGILTITDYSQRGMAFRRRISTDASVAESSAQFLESNMWYDQEGRGIASWMPNTAASKIEYDGLGRVAREFVTDRGGDAAPGATGNHAAANAVTGDIVFEQTNPTYSSEDRITRVTHWQRNHNATGTGALDGYTGSSSIAVTTFVDNLYDDADRRIGTINYGTNDSGIPPAKRRPARTTWPMSWRRLTAMPPAVRSSHPPCRSPMTRAGTWRPVNAPQMSRRSTRTTHGIAW